MSKPTGILRPLGLALVLAIGFGAVFALIAGWGISIWEGLHRESAFENLVVRADGMPLIRRYEYFGTYNNETFRALDGSAVPSPKNEDWLVGAVVPMSHRDWILFPLDANSRVRRFDDGQTPPNLWHFIHDGARDGRGYFVGYDSQSKLCVGFIGRDGFRPDQPPVEQWFPVDGVKLASGRVFPRNAGAGYWNARFSSDLFNEFPAWKVEMISGTQLLEVDLRQRSVTTLMESTDLIAMGLLETAAKLKAGGEVASARHDKLAVRTTDQVLLFDAPGKQHAAYLLPDDLRDRTITLYELDAGRALVIAGRPHPDRRVPDEVSWIDASGKVLRREEVSLGGGNPLSEETRARIFALIVPSPLLLAFMATVGAPLGDLETGVAPNYSTALAHSLAVFWPVLLVVTLLAAALAWYCCRWQRRYCQSSSIVWFVFILLLGVPGLVGYLFHRRWPVLEKCPACGHVVPRDRETCAKCGAAFPSPEPEGCEVFA